MLVLACMHACVFFGGWEGVGSEGACDYGSGRLAAVAEGADYDH